MADELDDWLSAFRRECGLRRVVILHGHMQDLVADTTQAGRWITARDAALQALAAMGYSQVVSWDRVHGVSGVDERTWRALQAGAVHARAPAQPQSTAGEEYDLGEPAPPPRGAPTAAPRGAAGNSHGVSPQDFLATVAHHLRSGENGEPVAFVIDWSHYLFGSANNLSEAERGWLLQIGQATRDAPTELRLHDLRRPQPLLVMVVDGALALPPQLHLNNPMFKGVAVPLPTRRERERALLSLAHAFDVTPALQANSTALADMTDALDGLAMRDILNLARLSRQTGRMRPDALVALYRYGTRRSPWEELDRDKLVTARERLAHRVKGQPQAIEAVNQVLVRAFTGLAGLQHSARQRTPKGVLFFVGPTGVGKTELAKALAQFIFGDEEACLRFDMSEFNHEHADQRLVGAPPGYVGYESGGQLTNAVKQRPFSLLLFDEIEKAHPRILDKFLQILEDGRLTDGKGETMSFSETMIVFTSNIGASQVDPEADDVRAAFVERVREHFCHKLDRPELLGRIGESNIVPFNFIRSEDFLVDIARTKLTPLRQRLREKWGIEELRFQDEARALRAIVRQSDPTAGGRGVPNAMMTHLFDPLSSFLFENLAHPDDARGRVFQVMQAGDRAAFIFDIA